MLKNKKVNKFQNKNKLLKKRKEDFYIKHNNTKKFVYIRVLTISVFILFSLISIILESEDSSKGIVEKKYYKKFEKFKAKFDSDSKLIPYMNISIISHIYNKKIQKHKKNKINVNICMSLNNKYYYPTLVSMESALINCNKEKTFLTYHIQCTPEVTQDILSILKSLVYKYPYNLEIIFYNMNDILVSLNNERYSQATYYRILSPIIFDIDRIIHIDADTLVLKDLSEMYEYDLDDNYFLGILDMKSDGVDFLGVKSEKYINCGVILINLDKIRQDKRIYDCIDVFNKNISLPDVDQTLINYVFYPKIGIMPSKYITFNFYDEQDIRFYHSKLRTNVDISELINSLDNTTIIHFLLCYPKIWDFESKYKSSMSKCEERKDCSCSKFHDLWYSYANKTLYYNDIYKFYKKN